MHVLALLKSDMFDVRIGDRLGSNGQTPAAVNWRVG